jgi:hypothetical protein
MQESFSNSISQVYATEDISSKTLVIPEKILNFVRSMFWDEGIKMNMPFLYVWVFRSFPDLFLPISFSMNASYKFILKDDNVVGYFSILPTTLEKAFTSKFNEDLDRNRAILFIGAFISENYRNTGILKHFLSSSDLLNATNKPLCFAYKKDNQIMSHIAENHLKDTWKRLGESRFKLAELGDVVVYMRQ